MAGIPELPMCVGAQSASPSILTEKGCQKCKLPKQLPDFHKCRSSEDGRQPRCKECNKKIREEFLKTHPGYRREQEKAYRAARRRQCCQYSKNWRTKNIERAKAASNEYGKRIRILDPERGRATCKRWRINNPEAAKKKDKRNKEKIMSTPRGAINTRIAVLVRISLKGNKHGCHWENLVGYTLAQLMRHLEKHFLPGMSWETRSLWHIDHKIPLSAFNFECPQDIDFRRAWALKNLQPLWKQDNLVKNNKLDRPFQPSLAI